MPVTESHWTDHLTEAEGVQLDDIQLRIHKYKEKIAILRKQERKLLETGTSRKRRAQK